MGTTAAGAACDAVVPVDAFLLRFRGEPWIVEILRFMVPFLCAVYGVEVDGTILVLECIERR